MIDYQIFGMYLININSDHKSLAGMVTTGMDSDKNLEPEWVRSLEKLARRLTEAQDLRFIGPAKQTNRVSSFLLLIYFSCNEQMYRLGAFVLEQRRIYFNYIPCGLLFRVCMHGRGKKTKLISINWGLLGPSKKTVSKIPD